MALLNAGNSAVVLLPAGQVLSVNGVATVQIVPPIPRYLSGDVFTARVSNNVVLGPYVSDISCNIVAVQNTVYTFDAVTPNELNKNQILQLQGLLGSGSGYYTWANRPNPVGNTGMLITISDYGGPGGSVWRSNGTYWAPVNGFVNLRAEAGTLAAPISTMAGLGAAAQYEPNPVKLPGGMAIRGKCILNGRIENAQTGVAGGASNNVYIGNNGNTTDNVAADLNYTTNDQTSFVDINVNFDGNGFRVHRNATPNIVAASNTGYVYPTGANVDNDLWLGTGCYSLAVGQNRLLLQRRWTLFF
jgi:hypothetical protein